VIFDTPPVSLFVDAAILSHMADGTLFVTRQNQTKRALATKCVQQLRVANARILGLVTTFCEGDDSLYYYAYYTQDGKRAEKSTLKHSNNGNSGSGNSGSGNGGGGKPAEPSVPARPIVTTPGRRIRQAPVESDASARTAPPDSGTPAQVASSDIDLDELVDLVDLDELDDLNELAEPDISTEPSASAEPGTGGTVYAPNAYRELPARSQRTSRRQR
jgi:hypothetical protein